MSVNHTTDSTLYVRGKMITGIRILQINKNLHCVVA